MVSFSTNKVIKGSFHYIIITYIIKENHWAHQYSYPFLLLVPDYLITIDIWLSFSEARKYKIFIIKILLGFYEDTFVVVKDCILVEYEDLES